MARTLADAFRSPKRLVPRIGGSESQISLGLGAVGPDLQDVTVEPHRRSERT